MLKINQILSLKIEKLAQGAGGLGYFESKVIFVPYTVPGDFVKIKVTEVKKRFARAQLLEIVTPSLKRIEPPCPVFGTCGGCQWQMLDYSEQMKQKQEFLEHQVKFVIKRSARTSTGAGANTNKVTDTHESSQLVSTSDLAVQVLPLVASPSPYRYRRRLRLKVHGLHIGYFAQNSHDLVKIEDCLIGQESLVFRLKSWIKAQKLDKETQGMQNTTPKKNLNKDKIETYEVDQDPESKEITITNLNSGATSFTQVNPEVNYLLIKSLCDWVLELKMNAAVHLTELYSGQGNLTFALHEVLPKGSTIKGVEMVKAAVQHANDKKLSLGILDSSIEFINCEVTQYLASSVFKGPLVLVDPPRSGLDPEVLKAIRDHSEMRHLIYISCDLATWSRDAILLLESPGWALTQVQAFDMFPQTDHFEVLSLFSKHF